MKNGRKISEKMVAGICSANIGCIYYRFLMAVYLGYFIFHFVNFSTVKDVVWVGLSNYQKFLSAVTSVMHLADRCIRYLFPVF